MKNYLILLALAVGFTFSGCDKDDEQAPPSKTAMLTAKSWKVTGKTTTINNGTPSDTYASAPACEKDNFTTFAADGTFVFDEGATKCASNELQTQPGTWKFENNETALTTTQGTNTVTQNIAEFSDSKMVLTVENSFTNGGVTTNYKYATTLEPK